MKAERFSIVKPAVYEIVRYWRHGITSIPLGDFPRGEVSLEPLCLKPDYRGKLVLDEESARVSAIWGRGTFGEYLKWGVIPVKTGKPRVVVASRAYIERGRNIKKGGVLFFNLTSPKPKHIRFQRRDCSSLDFVLVS